MRRFLPPTTVLLTTLTALALLGAAVAVHPPGLPPETDGPQEAANRLTVRRFYEAANGAIATGDLGSLAAIVGPTILADGTDPDPVRAGLARRLRALHATAPALRLLVTDLAVDGDLAIARVAAEGVGPAVFLGLQLLDPPHPWGPVDVLRLAEGRIVAYEGGVADAPLLEPDLALPWRLPADAPHGLTVRRLVLAAGATHTAAGVDRLRLLTVAAGAVTVEADATGMYATQPATLTAGMLLALPAYIEFTAANRDEAPAVLLDLTVARLSDHPAASAASVSQLRLAEPPAEPRAVIWSLAHAPTSSLPPGPVVLAMGWVTLPPDARLAWTTAGQVLLYVTAGTASTDLIDQHQPLVAGSGMIVPAGTVVLHGDVGPTTLLVVTLVPAAEPVAAISPAATHAAGRAVGGAPALQAHRSALLPLARKENAWTRG